jgi:hypothetical protein
MIDNLNIAHPYYPRSNGLAERFVQEAKNLLKRCSLDDIDVQFAVNKSASTLPQYQNAEIVAVNVKGKLNEIKYRHKIYADRHTMRREQLNLNDKVVVQKPVLDNGYLPLLLSKLTLQDPTKYKSSLLVR